MTASKGTGQAPGGPIGCPRCDDTGIDPDPCPGPHQDGLCFNDLPCDDERFFRGLDAVRRIRRMPGGAGPAGIMEDFIKEGGDPRNAFIAGYWEPPPNPMSQQLDPSRPISRVTVGGSVSFGTIGRFFRRLFRA